jgi:hypothetical protein
MRKINLSEALRKPSNGPLQEAKPCFDRLSTNGIFNDFTLRPVHPELVEGCKKEEQTLVE